MPVSVNKQNKCNYLVIGLGRFGRHLARTLHQYGHEVMAIDQDMPTVQSVIDAKEVSNALQMDAIDTVALKKLSLETYEAVCLCVGGDIENSVLIAATLKDQNIKNIVAKASSPIHGKILEKLGITNIIYPEAAMGERVAKQLIGLSFLEEFALNENFSIAEILMPKQYAGMSLIETDIRSGHHLNILAIRRVGGHFNVSPTPKTSLQRDDHLLVLGTHEDIANFRNLSEEEL